MKKNSIDDVCPASTKVYGMLKKPEYDCKVSRRVCYAPRSYEGCYQYLQYNKDKAVLMDHEELRII